MSKSSKDDAWILTLYWGYGVQSRMHALWGVRRFPDQLAPLLAPVLKVYSELYEDLGKYILGRKFWDYAEAPLYDRDFVAIRIDFFITENGTFYSKTSTYTQSKNKDALNIQAMFLDWLVEKLNKVSEPNT